MQIRSSFKSPKPRMKAAMPSVALCLVLSSCFFVFFWIWFLLIRTPLMNSDREYVQGMAMSDILEACNTALTDQEVTDYFRPQDIKESIMPAVSGVSIYVSVFEVSRNNLYCHWDGINPAEVTRRQRLTPKDVEP